MNHQQARPPLRVPQLPPGGLWSAFQRYEETGSTNADAADAARAGAAEGLVVVAEYQRAGRGRAGRGWSSPPRAGLAVSVLLRPAEPARGWPPVPSTRWGWLPLLAGVALVETVTSGTGLDATLKWPNDLLVGEAKCAGILAEVANSAVVVGVGLNVSLRADELPAPAPGAMPATSLALAGVRNTDRQALLAGLLDRFADWYGRWRAAAGDADRSGLHAAYQRRCGTLGRRVRARLPDGTELVGVADTVDESGRLELRAAEGTRILAAGDVTHLRPV